MMLFPHRTSVTPLKGEQSMAEVNNGTGVGAVTASGSKRVSVHRICLFGFDENMGNSLLASSKVNKRPSIVSHTDAELAEICLPDGGHLREHDAMSMVFKTSASAATGSFLYGYCCFRNVRNSQEKRGARQTSILIITDSPGMDLFRPFLVDALEILMNGSNWGDTDYWRRALNALKYAIESGFNHRSNNSSRRLLQFDDDKDNLTTIEMWNRSYTLRLPSFLPGEFGGASLKDLLRVFREKTMRLWYAVAAERRVIIVSSSMSASSICNLIMATPLLLGDLAPFVLPSLEPYITLAVVDRVSRRKTFVCGSNNVLFQNKTEWWDVCADATSGNIVGEYHHIHTEKQGACSTGATPTNEDPDLSAVSSPPPTPSSSMSKLLGIRRKLTHHRTSSASFGTTSSPHHHKLSGGVEMAFVSRVLHDMDFQSEAWLRRQFHDFTLSFLNRVARREGTHQADLTSALAGLFPGVSIMQPRIARFAEQFPSTTLWKRYRAKQDEVWGGGSPEQQHRALPKTAATLSPRSAPSPSSISLGDSNFLLNRAGVKTLAPFTMETATGAFRQPTGFVSVKEQSANSPVSPRAASPKLRISSPPSRMGENQVENGAPTMKTAIAPGTTSTSGGAVKRWIKVHQEDGEPYYWNVSSGETRWEISSDDLKL